MTIMSKTTYSSKSNAKRAGAKHERFNGETHQLPSGRWCYMITETVKSNRGGGRKFMTGVQVRKAFYGAETVGASVFAVCEYLSKAMDMPVPHRAHVEEVCVRYGVTPASARAGYTHYKQVKKLDYRAGRPTEEAEEKFNALLLK